MEECFELDGKNYIITNEIKENDNIYYFLSNEADIYDVMIRKSKVDSPDVISPLDNKNEFTRAINLLKKEMTERFNA